MSSSDAMPPREIFLSATDGQPEDPDLDDTYDSLTYKFPTPIFAPDGYSLHVSVASFSIPHTFKVVSLYNCVLKIDAMSIIIVTGNYSIYQLVAALQAQLPSGYRISFDPITLKATLTGPGVFTVGGTMCGLLGFQEGDSGSWVSSRNTVAMEGVQSIYIDSDLKGDNIDCGPLNSKGLLCRVLNTAAPLGMLHYQDTAGTAGVLVQSGQLHGITIYLLDEKRQPLLASQPYSLTLSVKYVKTGRSQLRVDRPDALIWSDIIGALANKQTQ